MKADDIVATQMCCWRRLETFRRNVVVSEV